MVCDNVGVLVAGLLLLVLTVVVAGGRGTNQGSFLDLPSGRQFLAAFVSTQRASRVNIFIPATDDEEYNIPVEVVRSLSHTQLRSVAVFKVEDGEQVESILTLARITALNVALLNTERQIELFRSICESEVVRVDSWLVLGPTSILSQPSRFNLPLDNLITFASMTNATTTTSSSSPLSVQLHEAYAVRRSAPYLVRRLGEWQEGQGRVNLPKAEWSDRRTNLTGLHLRCTTMDQAPFTYLSEADGELNVNITGGYAKDVWDTLQEIHGFTYSCKTPRDHSFGTLVEGRWSGLVGDVVDGRADVVVTSLDHNSARSAVLSFTVGLREIGYRLVSRRPGLMDQTWTSFTSELMPDAWLGTLAFVVLAPPCLAFCARYSPLETQAVTLKDAYILAIGAFAIQGSWLEVRSISTRIVFLTIFVATLVVYAHYTSALVSLLTVASTSQGFTSLQGILNDGSYKFGFQGGGFLEEGFKNAHNTIFREVWDDLIMSEPGNLVDDPHIGIAKVINERYVYMIEENEYKSLFGNMCKVRLLKGSYFTTQTGFALAKDSPLKKIFDVQLMRMRDGGVLSRAWQQWQTPSALCTAQRVVAIELSHLFTAFLLLLLGLGLAIIFLPCERLHWNTVGRRKARRLEKLKQKQQQQQDTSSPTSSLFPSNYRSTLDSTTPLTSSHFHTHY